MLFYIHLKGNIRNAITAILGVGISIFVVLISLGVANGLANNTLGSMLSIVPHVKLESNFGAIKNYDDEISKVLKVNGVSDAYPKINSKGMFKYASVLGNFVEGVVIDAFRLEDLKRFFSKYIIHGDLDNLNDGILIGEELAHAMLAKVGDKVKIISHENIELVTKIVGIFSTGFYDYDVNFIVISLDSAKKFLNIDAVTQIDVKLKNIYMAEAVAKNINNITKLKASSWMIMHKQLLKGIALEKSVVILFEILFLIITGFLVLILISNIVRGKVKEIGILRAMGFSKLSITKSFIMLAYVYSLFGILLGLLLTYVGYYIITTFTFDVINEIYYIPDKIPFSLTIKEILVVIFGGQIMLLLGALIPAIQGGRLDPLEALKYE